MKCILGKCFQQGMDKITWLRIVSQKFENSLPKKRFVMCFEIIPSHVIKHTLPLCTDHDINKNIVNEVVVKPSIDDVPFSQNLVP